MKSSAFYTFWAICLAVTRKPLRCPDLALRNPWHLPGSYVEASRWFQNLRKLE
jgi:hypothetical protein